MTKEIDFDTWAFEQCNNKGHKIESVKDSAGKNIAWVNTTTKEKFILK